MSYVILGGRGQLGQALSARLADAVALDHTEADVTRPESLRAALERLRPGVVFNCAAYNAVDRAESEPDAAFAVNAFGPRHLTLLCRELGAVLVHYSTNYVFGLDETRRTPYRESDAPGPVNVYGASKLAGEYFVRTLCARHFVIRTCGLYGGAERNFVATMLRLAREGKPLRIVADQLCTPTWTVDLAEWSIALVQTGAHGLYQLTNAGACSWYQFARAILEEWGLQVAVQPITTAEHGAAARRPAYSVLAATACEALGLPPLRPWRQALAQFLKGSVPHTRAEPR